MPHEIEVYYIIIPIEGDSRAWLMIWSKLFSGRNDTPPATRLVEANVLWI